MKDLGQIAVSAALRSAQQYMHVHNLKADEKVLWECCKSWCKIKLPEAIADARAAYDCGMNQAGDATFIASMVQAGIEAAKEAGFL